MERKYGQHGYQDADRERVEREREKSREKPKGGPRGSKAREAPRGHEDAGFSGSSALFALRHDRPSAGRHSSRKPMSEMQSRSSHSCKNCRHFDTSAQFECTQPIPERITKKDLRTIASFSWREPPSNAKRGTPVVVQTAIRLLPPAVRRSQRLRQSLQKIRPPPNSQNLICFPEFAQCYSHCLW